MDGSKKETYKEAKRIYQFELRKTKHEFFKRHCANLGNRDIFNILKKIDGNSSSGSYPSSLRNGSKMLQEPKEIANFLLKSFFPAPRQCHLSQLKIVSEVETEMIREISEHIPSFRKEEIIHAANEISSQAAPGEDGISADIIKFSTTILMQVLLDIFNACLRLSYFPKKWKIARVCVIRKPNKNVYDDPKSYRPISVPNTLGKLFESLILKRLQWLSKKYRWISENQHGFTENRGTDTAAHVLVHYIETGFAKKAFTGAVFLDIASAFDAAWHPAIVKALINKSGPNYLTRIIDNFLKDRTVILKSGLLKQSHTALLGCPQGGVLSPFLWNVLIDQIIRESFPFPQKVVAYADDIVLLVTNPNPEQVTDQLQIMCNTIVKKLKGIMLEVNAEKCVFMLFNRKQSPYQVPSIEINQDVLEVVESTRY